jgi:hypothetical protein
LGAIEWWNMYGSPAKNLHKLAVKVLSQVVNTSFAERCWSTYSFIHNVKRNSLNADRAESLVYVHYNLRLLSHYCDADGNAFCKRDMTWDNNPEETNLQDGTIVLERLQEELLSDHDGNHIPGGDMPPPSTTRVPDSSVIPLSTMYTSSIVTWGPFSCWSCSTITSTCSSSYSKITGEETRSFSWKEEILEHST